MLTRCSTPANLKARLYRARTRTQITWKTWQISAQFAVLIEGSFPLKNRNLFSIKTRSFADDSITVMHKLLIMKTVVCRGEFHHVTEVVAYLLKILILTNFENISIDNDISKTTLITGKRSRFLFNVI